MLSLQKIDFKLLNCDIVKFKDGTEFVKLQGIVPMSEKKKSSILSGEYETMEIFGKPDDYDEICHKCKNIDIIKFSGIYSDRKFKPVSIDGFTLKK